MYSKNPDISKIKGMVVANDVDVKRAYMLSH
jgi:hypothetical protein